MYKKLHPSDFLIADPSILGDLSFHRSAVIICSIEENAPMGFIFNKPYDFDLNEMVPEVTVNLPLFYGGPVDEDKLFFIYHAEQPIIDHSKQIAQQLYLGGDTEQAFVAIEEQRLHQGNSRFFLGYSGWAKGQLEHEIDLNSWLIQKNNNLQLLFNKKPEDVWRDAMLLKGGKHTLWANTPHNPTHN